jgi:hypothetical membrane protein
MLVTAGSRARLAGVLYFLGGSQFWLVTVFAEATNRGFSVHTDALSDLGMIGSPTGYAWDPSLFLLGVTWLAAVVLVWRSAGPKWFVLNLLPGITTVVIALFPEGSINAIHTTAAYSTFVLGAVVAILDAKMLRSPFRWYSAALGAFSLAVLIGGIALGSGALGYGGAERLVAYPIIAWVIGLGGYLMATPPDARPS